MAELLIGTIDWAGNDGSSCHNQVEYMTMQEIDVEIQYLEERGGHNFTFEDFTLGNRTAQKICDRWYIDDEEV